MRLLSATVHRFVLLALTLVAGSCSGGKGGPAPEPSPSSAPETRPSEPATTARSEPSPSPVSALAATAAPAVPPSTRPAARPATPPNVPAEASTPAPSPTATPVAAPTADPARVAALVGDAEGALAQGKWTEATTLFGEALALDPANARARAGRARATTASLGVTRTFVPDISSAEGAEGSVKEIDDFEVDDLDVKRAVHIPGRTELEGTPARVKPGDTYTVKIYVRNQSKKKKRIIKITELSVHRLLNGADTSMPLTPLVREVPAKTRLLVATLTGPWEDDVASWILDVRVMTEGNDMYQNRLVWK